jgi:flagellin
VASVTAANLGDTTTPADVPTYTAAASYYTTGVTDSGGASKVEDAATNQVAAATYTADPTGTGGIATMSYSDNAGEALSSTDLLTQADAQSALNDLNIAISDVAAQDGYIGAQINTLNSISQVMSTQQENVVSAQNAIQATDYASATSNMSKYEILSQTGIAALAQANSVQQEVTKLLQ